MPSSWSFLWLAVFLFFIKHIMPAKRKDKDGIRPDGLLFNVRPKGKKRLGRH